MSASDRIRSLLESIRAVGNTYATAADAAAFADRTISASAARAQFEEKRVSAAARMSVAASAMNFVSGFAGTGKLPASMAFHLARIADEAALLAPQAPVEHEPDENSVRPEGWDGPEAGPYSCIGRNGARLLISRRTRLPGGDWTAYYGGVPAAFGQCPAAAAASIHSFCKMLDLGRLPVSGGLRRRPRPPHAGQA